MKVIKFIFVTLFLCAFALTEVNAQATVVKDDLGYWAIYAPSGYYYAYDSQEVLTPDGTLNLRINIQLPLDDEWVVEAILNGKYELEGWYANTMAGVIPVIITIYPNGRLKVEGHLEMEPDPE